MTKRIGGWLVACSVMTALSVAGPASSAPSEPTPGPILKRAPSVPAPVVGAVTPLTVKIIADAQACGSPSRVRVSIKNDGNQLESGTVEFADGSRAGTKTAPFSVGPMSTREVLLSGGTLACGVRLPAQTVRVIRGSASTAFFAKTLMPTAIVMETGFPMPPATETRHWLRRVALSGTCSDARAMIGVTGAPVAPSAPQDVKATLTIKGQTTELTGSITTGNVFLTAPVALDCAASGIPSIGFSLASGAGGSGTLAPQSVTFEP